MISGLAFLSYESAPGGWCTAPLRTLENCWISDMEGVGVGGVSPGHVLGTASDFPGSCNHLQVYGCSGVQNTVFTAGAGRQ